jgi:hypothetical protein
VSSSPDTTGTTAGLRTYSGPGVPAAQIDVTPSVNGDGSTWERLLVISDHRVCLDCIFIPDDCDPVGVESIAVVPWRGKLVDRLMIRIVINKILVTNALICMASHTSFICILFTRNVEYNLHPILREMIGSEPNLMWMRRLPYRNGFESTTKMVNMGFS